MISDLFDISLDELVMDKQPETIEQKSGFYEKTVELSKKVLTEENKEKMSKAFKVFLFILAFILVVDLITLVIFFLMNGAPS